MGSTRNPVCGAWLSRKLYRLLYTHIKMCILCQYIWLKVRQKGVHKPSDVDFVWLSAISASPHVVTSEEQFLLLVTPSASLHLNILIRPSNPKVRVVQTFCGGWSSRNVVDLGGTNRRWHTWSKGSSRGITLIRSHTFLNRASYASGWKKRTNKSICCLANLGHKEVVDKLTLLCIVAFQGSFKCFKHCWSFRHSVIALPGFIL